MHRPPDLEELFRKKLAGEPYDEKVFAARLRSSVAEIVQKQISTGIDVIDDGEFSKVDFFSYAKYRLDGIEARAVPVRQDDTASANKFLHPAMKSVMSSLALRQQFAQFFADTEPREGAVWPGSVVQMYIPQGTAIEKSAIFFVTKALAYKPDEVKRDIDNLKAALQGKTVADVFMPVVAPAMFATRHVNEHYKSEEEYYFAVADVLHEEYQAIIDAGFLIQIDDVSLPGRYRLQVPNEGIAAFQRWCDLAVDALNHALKGIPDSKVRYHLCWSSQNSPHTDDAPLSDLIRAILRIKAQGYQIEAAKRSTRT